MEQEKDTTEKKSEPSDNISTDEPKVTHVRIVGSKWYSISIAHIISILLLIVSTVLAFVNYRTYSKMAEYNVETINNYNIRNRPFVKIEPREIIIKKEQVPHPDGGHLSSHIYSSFILKNFGQFPAFIEDINIWITDTSGVLKDFKFPRGKEPKNTKNLALFQDEEKDIPWKLIFSIEAIERITKVNETDYFVYKINYKILSNEKSLQRPFSYWVKCKHHNIFADDQQVTVYNFSTIECGTDDISPGI